MKCSRYDWWDWRSWHPRHTPSRATGAALETAGANGVTGLNGYLLNSSRLYIIIKFSVPYIYKFKGVMLIDLLISAVYTSGNGLFMSKLSQKSR